jgi:hypothetical protein
VKREKETEGRRTFGENINGKLRHLGELADVLERDLALLPFAGLARLLFDGFFVVV